MPRGLKSLRENQALQLQPRKGQPAYSPRTESWVVFRERYRSRRAAEAILTRFSRPSGTNHGCDLFPGLASWATFRSPPTGLELQSLVLTQTLKPQVFSIVYGPTKVVP